MLRLERFYCRIRLERKSDEMFATASVDCTGGALINGITTLVGIDCKVQIYTGTHQCEHEHGELLFHSHSIYSKH
jgi:hypothetical protein